MKPKTIEEIMNDNPELFEQVNSAVLQMMNDRTPFIVNHIQNLIEDETGVLIFTRETRKYLIKHCAYDGY